MKSKLIVLSLVAVLLTSVAMPSFAGRAHAAAPVAVVHVASATNTHPAFFDKTRFVVDMGVAYFCIHHVYKNYKRGLYNKGANDRLRHIIAAGVVLAIAYNRLHAAYTTANGSSSPTLHKLIAPLNAVLAKLHGQQSDLAGGTLDTKSFQGMYSSADSFGKTATSNGYLYHDISIPLPAGS